MKRLFLIVLGLSICLFLASCSVSETNERSIDESNSNQTAQYRRPHRYSPDKAVRRNPEQCQEGCPGNREGNQ